MEWWWQILSWVGWQAMAAAARARGPVLVPPLYCSAVRYIRPARPCQHEPNILSDRTMYTLWCQQFVNFHFESYWKKAQFTKRTLSRGCEWPALVVIVFVLCLLLTSPRKASQTKLIRYVYRRRVKKQALKFYAESKVGWFTYCFFFN